jgi:hypothetical protein
MVRSAVAATALVGVVAVHATFFVPANPGSITLVGATVGVRAFALVLMVMRDMLTTAVQHKAELGEVV